MKIQIQGHFHADKTLSRSRLTAGLLCPVIVVVMLLSGLGAEGQSGQYTPEADLGLAAFWVFAVYSNGGATNTIGDNVGGAQTFGRLCLGAPSLGSHLAKASPKISSNADVLYGTASLGGNSGQGTVFSVNSDGTGFTVLHNFSGGADGGFPTAGLILSSNTLYGTTLNGGSTGNGTVFSINTNTSTLTVLHNFTARNQFPYTNSDGGNPHAELILSGNTLYGTASDGGLGNAGTVFAINLANTNFTVLHQFTKPNYDPNSVLTNSDGATPSARLILSGQTLFGTTSYGGAGGVGTIFAVNTNGSNFTLLHGFSAPDPIYQTNSDGTSPAAGLIISGGTLYGTAYQGGSANAGTVFSVNTNGANFTNLYSFTGNSDGFEPAGDLLLTGNTLVGTTRMGGNPTIANGTVFAIDIDGKNFTVVHTFTAGNYDPDLPPVGNNLTNSDGAIPLTGLVLSGNILYGTTSAGGTGGNGTLFSLSPALLTITGIQLAKPNLLINGINGLSNSTYSLLMNTNPASPLNQWMPIATNVLTSNGNFTITATNAVDPAAKQRFYILEKH